MSKCLFSCSLSCKEKKNLWLLLAVLFIFTISFWAWDRPIAEWTHLVFPGTTTYTLSNYLAVIFKSNQILALALPFVLVGLFVKKRCPMAASALFSIATALVIAFVIAFIIKFIFARYRPNELLEHGQYGFHWLSLQENFNSTPSGHTVMAFALFLSIARYVRCCCLKTFLWALAIAVGLSRLVLDAHYLSDVVLGAYIGYLSVSITQCLIKRESSCQTTCQR